MSESDIEQVTGMLPTLEHVAQEWIDKNDDLSDKDKETLEEMLEELIRDCLEATIEVGHSSSGLVRGRRRALYGRPGDDHRGRQEAGSRCSRRVLILRQRRRRCSPR